MDATEGQQGAESDAQHADRESLELQSNGQPLDKETQSRSRHKRQLSRSLDLSRRSTSSRAAKQQKQGEIPDALRRRLP